MKSPAELKRAKRARTERLRLVSGLALALLLHLLILLVLPIFPNPSPGPLPEVANNNPLVMRPLSADRWAQNRGPRALSERRLPPRPTPEPKPEVRPKGQVVDVAPGNREVDPNAKYLAESNNRVEKETRAKEQTPNYRNAMPKETSPVPRTGSGEEAVARMAGNQGVGADNRPQKNAGQHGALEIPTTKRRQELAMRLDRKAEGAGPSLSNHPESQTVEGNSSRMNVKPGDSGPAGEESSPGRVGPHGLVTLTPSQALLDRIAGAAPNDHLSEVAEGDGTYLNTREWKYAGFFNRVKQSVGTHWDPGTSLRQRDPSGEIYGGRDRYTVLHVTLDTRGSLQNVQVEKSSGLDFLDQEAIASFRRAQPFPNPPPGLFGSEQTFTFSFGFFLELGSGPRMRLFKGSN